MSGMTIAATVGTALLAWAYSTRVGYGWRGNLATAFAGMVGGSIVDVIASGVRYNSLAAQQALAAGVIAVTAFAIVKQGPRI